MVTVLLAGGALFLKYQLEELRGVVQSQAELRVGARLDIGAVKANGLRGLRIDDVKVFIDSPAGPSISLKAPEVFVYLDVVELLYGHVTIDRIQVDRAQILATRPEDGRWWNARAGGIGRDKDLAAGTAFRIVGNECRLELRNIVGQTRLTVEDLAFDVSRLSESRDIAAKVSGVLAGFPKKRLEANVRYASMEDFDLRAQCGELSAEDINVFLPSSQRFVLTGSATPSIRAAGYPNKTLVLSLDMPFREIAVRDQPELILPAAGTLRALANYDFDTHLLTLVTAKAESEQIAGRVEGVISFEESVPHFDLQVEANQLPVMELIDYALEGRGSEYGEFTLDLKDPYKVSVALRGTPETPVISADAGVSSGAVSFKPKNPDFPSVDLVFGLVNVSWDSESAFPGGTLNITDGSISHADTGLRAHNLSGSLTLGDHVVALEPLSAEIRGNTLVGRARYDVAKQKAEVAVSGVAAELEKTPLGSRIKNVRVRGSANARCTGLFEKGHYALDLTVDATQAEVDYQWWFRKPLGVGATINALNIDVKSGEAIRISSSAAVDASPLNAVFDFVHESGHWRMQRVRLHSDSVSVGSAGKCLRIPYAVSGGVCREGFVEWQRKPGAAKASTTRMGGFFNTISLLPDGSDTPIEGKGLRIETILDDTVPTDRKGAITVTADAGRIPPLGSGWFLPFRSDDPALNEEFSLKPRNWTYSVAVNGLEMPPWRGTEFACEVSSTAEEIGLSHFQAKVDGGRLEGSYHFEKVDNVAELSAKWQDIPASYVLRHLHFPDVLTGTMTGEVQYAVDYDDPDTLKGKGSFEIGQGQFSADFIRMQFEEQLGSDAGALPNSLKFTRFRGDVLIQGDRVEISDLLLQAQGIRVSGAGQYVVDGDVDFKLKAAIAPKTAKQMPLLLNSFNIDGHKLTLNDIELAFDIKGPMFNPSGQVVGLPSVAVTLVSGAGEVASEAIKIIDAPRQILLDLVKIFGAITGAPGK